MADNPPEYELLVRELLEARILNELSQSNICVFHNKGYRGKSGHTHKIDIAVELHVAELLILIIVECKKYHKKVGIDDIMELAGRIDDIGAHKGVLVTTLGFQAGAVRFAKSKGIALVKACDRIWIPMLHANTDLTPIIKSRECNLKFHIRDFHNLGDVRKLPPQLISSLKSMDCEFFIMDYQERPFGSITDKDIKSNQVYHHYYLRARHCFDIVGQGLEDLRLTASGIIAFLSLGIFGESKGKKSGNFLICSNALNRIKNVFFTAFFQNRNEKSKSR